MDSADYPEQDLVRMAFLDEHLQGSALQKVAT
jgi:hypothetical protein